MKKYLIETMPDHLRESHRKAGNWGTYPANGAERSVVDESELPEEGAEYDHVVIVGMPSYELTHEDLGTEPEGDE